MILVKHFQAISTEYKYHSQLNMYTPTTVAKLQSILGLDKLINNYEFYLGFLKLTVHNLLDIITIYHQQFIFGVFKERYIHVGQA